MSEKEKSLITEEVVALIRDDPSIDKTFIGEFIVKKIQAKVSLLYHFYYINITE